MTLAEVNDTVDRLAAGCFADEVAHSIEDGLYQSVLEAIRDGAPDPEKLAEAALRTASLDFGRWCS